MAEAHSRHNPVTPDEPVDTGASERRHIYQVLELTRVIKEALEDYVGQVWVEGEISSLSRPSSGHVYFTLKDERAQLAAVLFKGNQRGLATALKDGARVRAFGDITVYERDGKYQLIVRQIEEAGRGSLHEQFERLKKKLSEEGLFEENRKQPLPLLPRRIGVVTSPTGAAIRDMLNVLLRRFPNLHVLLAPVKVQGEGAAGKIAKAIAYLNENTDTEVIIVGRGGGSLEDLWAFNEEAVARAVAASRTPIISAVGHETDFTLCDFAADVRAPTPSAAAELAVPLKSSIEERLKGIRHALSRALRTHALGLRNRLTRCERSYVFREPHNLLKRYRERIESLAKARTQHLGALFRQRQQRADDLTLRLDRLAATAIKGHRQDLRRLQTQLHALNPTAVLARGYSLTRTDDGAVIRRASDLEEGQRLHTRLAEGSMTSLVEAITAGEDHGENSDRTEE